LTSTAIRGIASCKLKLAVAKRAAGDEITALALAPTSGVSRWWPATRFGAIPSRRLQLFAGPDAPARGDVRLGVALRSFESLKRRPEQRRAVSNEL
jgi:hypothetical protein